MTLVFAWVRRVRDVHELVVAADSRLTGTGSVWDCAPKIVPLPRTDSVIAFAGTTDVAYPSMLQIVNAIACNPASRERRYDVTQLASTVQDVLNQMLTIRVSERDLAEEARRDNRRTQFVLAGWSWRYQRFGLWEYRFRSGAGRGGGSFRRTQRTGNYRGDQRVQVAVIGDAGRVGMETLRERTTGSPDTFPQSLNMEPLEVLRDIIRSGDHYTVGGSPQVTKLYRHLNAEQFGVLWRDRPGDRAVSTFAGRPLLPYEKAYYTFIDPDDPDHHARRS